MNVLFISNRAEEANHLETEWDSCVRSSEEGVMQSLKDIPVDLRRIRVRQAGITRNGRLQIPENELFAGDGVILDFALAGQRTEEAVAEAKKRVPPGVAVMVLCEADDAPEAIKAMRAGAADCIVRKEGYEIRLLQAMAREVRYQALQREKEEILSRENRLRRVLECLPFGVVLLARSGTILSINRAGLGLFGFAEQGSIVGKAIRDLAAGADRERIGEWLDGICAGAGTPLSMKFIGADRKPTGVRLWATKLPDQGIQGSSVLLALYSEADGPERETAQQIELEYRKRMQDLQESQSAQKTEWESALDYEQSRRMEAERERSALEAELRKAGESIKALKERLDSERASWQEMKRQMENRIREAEEKQTAVQAALREAGDRLTTIEEALHTPEESGKPGGEMPRQEPAG